MANDKNVASNVIAAVEVSSSSSTEEDKIGTKQLASAAIPSSSPTNDNARARPKPVLRRSKGVDTPVENSSMCTVNQRLVEYFCIVTSKPRWDRKTIKALKLTIPPGGNASTPDFSTEHQPLDMKAKVGDHKAATIRSRGITIKDEGKEEKESDGQPEHASSSLSPATRIDGNIHMPQHDYDTTASVTAAELFTFSPVITARYPLTDYVDNPLNPMILQFCYPSDDIVTATPHYTMPRVHHFVLTLGCGRKLYGTCLTVLEEYEDESDRTELPVLPPAEGTGPCRNGKYRPKTLYIPKVLCLLSTWPYLTAFREYLSQLYRLAVTTNVMTAPLERYIVNLCCEIPAPPPGAYEIQLPILDSTIRFWAPPAKLPIAYTALPYHILFECLDVDHVLTVWTALLLERKILLISSQSSVLTVCAEILCSILFPLRWSHLYVPLLPRMLCPILDAPVPYLCGIVRDNYLFANSFVAAGGPQDTETVVVDLDRNTVDFVGGAAADLPTPPLKEWSKLQAALTASAGDVFWKARGLEKAYHAQLLLKKSHNRSLETLRPIAASRLSCPQWEEKLSTLDHAFNLAYTPESPNLNIASASHDEQSQWDCVQEAFLRFFVALFKGYRKFLIGVDASGSATATTANRINNTQPSFDQAAFVADFKGDSGAFVYELCNTQHFDDFLSRRMYSPGEPDLVFFDQSIDAKLNRSKLKIRKVETPFLHAAKVHKNLTKLHALPPNDEGLPFRKSRNGKKVPYIYHKLPEVFDMNLLCTPRPIPQMISAEFDRQDILVAKLRANHNNNRLDEPGGDDDPTELSSCDYDPSPEVASFTVFFLIYSSQVGRDWQKYSQTRRENDAKDPPTVKRKSVVMNEKKDAIATKDTLEDEALDSFFQDVSLGCCGACSESGIMVLSTTLSYIGADDAYSRYCRKPVAQHENLVIFSRDKDDVNVLETDDAVVVAEYEEAREMAAAQLEVAFDTLATMTLRCLSVDSDAYLSLMEACGRCGDTKRALRLVELMKKDGFVVDSEVLAYFVAAFAHNNCVPRGHSQISAVGGADNVSENENVVEMDGYSRFLEQGIDSAKEEKFNTSIWSRSQCAGSRPAVYSASNYDRSDDKSDDGSDMSSNRSSAGSSTLTGRIHLHPLRQKKKKKRKRKKRKSSGSETRVTEMIARQVALGESLLDLIYPNLVIDTESDSCPQCSNTLTENDVVAGWKPCAFQDFTTQCPKCRHRFVPRFVVTCTAFDFEGSQGIQTPLYCEFLSPWVLRKEFQHIIKGIENGIDKLLEPEWRSGTGIRATLFWNLVACCRRYRLPFAFLLQGHFQNPLVLPRKPDEI